MGVKLITFFSKSWVRRVIGFRHLLGEHSSVITTSPIFHKLLFLSAHTGLLSFLERIFMGSKYRLESL